MVSAFAQTRTKPYHVISRSFSDTHPALSQTNAIAAQNVCLAIFPSLPTLDRLLHCLFLQPEDEIPSLLMHTLLRIIYYYAECEAFARPT